MEEKINWDVYILKPSIYVEKMAHFVVIKGFLA